VISAAAALLFVATACTSQHSTSLGPPRPTSSAALHAITAAPRPLQRFYNQRLTWHSCDNGFQCATLAVPLDYSHPSGRVLHLAVIAHRASGTPHGSLIINPGGPGASGVTFEEEAAGAFAELTDHYNLVSFDPRGVGRSDPIRCVSGKQLDAFINTNPVPTTAAQRTEIVDQARMFANACYHRNGSYLEHVSTLDSARDMDVLRAALGDRKLTYYGASYGTYLGAKYAQLFPTRIRAMVLDGAVNPDEPSNAENRIQAEGFQTDLDDFLAACVQSGGCPLGSSVAAAHAQLERLRADVTANPIPVGNRELTSGEFFEGLAGGLYSTQDWPQLWAALGALGHRDGSAMLAFSDAFTERNANGSYSNLLESNIAIDCIDHPYARSVGSYVRSAQAFSRVSPDFGAAIEYGSLPCAFWRVPPVEQVHPVHAAAAPPILVIGTTRDPATPYVWARALAHQLHSGVLLTYNGDGHTAYLRGDSCVDSVVKDYMLNLMTPKAGTRCS
jgi:pimeloyl-ACP methyl ester carboxylesterase